ncbi:MAG TPA: sarcosine oxidase subunit gamma family protein [Steroidobacteraceae bacterium]|jgi:heterotetrameric sarcosine oxidase gamma subunit
MREAGIDLDAHPGRVKVRVRVSMSAVAAIPRGALAEALRAQSVNEATSLWLGPDQWLLISDRVSADALIAHCANELGKFLHYAVDVSASLACAHVSGPSALALLRMGSGVQWSEQCVRTRFASIPIIAHRLAEDAFDLYYDRSYRYHLDRWFAHAQSDPLLTDIQCRSSS